MSKILLVDLAWNTEEEDADGYSLPNNDVEVYIDRSAENKYVCFKRRNFPGEVFFDESDWSAVLEFIKGELENNANTNS